MARLYQAHPNLRFLRLKGVTKGVDIDTSFIQARPIGKVTVAYTIDKQGIRVSADFKDLERSRLEKVFMLNEQGATLFRKYLDSQGTTIGRLEDRSMGWNKRRMGFS